MKTNIKGPYDYVDRDDMAKVTCQIPESIYYSLFHHMFTRRGAQDRIIATLLDIFYRECLNQKVPLDANPSNENRAIEILNQIGRKLNYKNNE